MVYKSVKSSGFKSAIKENQRPLDLATQQLAQELHKPIIKKIKKRIVYSSSKDNVWGADVADMQLISKFNRRICFLLCIIDIFSKYAWVVPVKDKTDKAIANAFQKF